MNYKKRPQRRTLFDPDFQKHDEWLKRASVPYSVALTTALCNSALNFPEDEVSIVSHAVEHEIACYEPRGVVSGPLKIRTESRRVQLSHTKTSWRIPSPVEIDDLEFEDCAAQAIILIERDGVFEWLRRASHRHLDSLLLVSTHGIPRAGVRRLVRRLCERFGIPTYLLSDNDTWGYFMFSVLRRGLIAPHASCTSLAVPDVRFLGVRAGDKEKLGNGAGRAWQEEWDLRLKYMRQYKCFRSKGWQREFNTFEKNRLAIDSSDLEQCWDPNQFFAQYWNPRIEERSWLK